MQSPFSRWGNWGLESFDILPQIWQICAGHQVLSFAASGAHCWHSAARPFGIIVSSHHWVHLCVRTIVLLIRQIRPSSVIYYNGDLFSLKEMGFQMFSFWDLDWPKKRDPVLEVPGPRALSTGSHSAVREPLSPHLWAPWGQDAVLHVFVFLAHNVFPVKDQ